MYSVFFKVVQLLFGLHGSGKAVTLPCKPISSRTVLNTERTQENLKKTLIFKGCKFTKTKKTHCRTDTNHIEITHLHAVQGKNKRGVTVIACIPATALPKPGLDYSTVGHTSFGAPPRTKW